MIKVVIFDFDGVLTTDSTGGSTTCKYISEKTKIDYSKLQSCYKKHNRELNTGKLKSSEVWDEFCECIGQELDISILQEAYDSTPANNAMFDLAKKLKRKYQVGIITDNKKDRLEFLRKKMELDETFDSIILSADVGFVKDSKEIFDAALQSLPVKAEECVFIDNKESNLIVPKEMGFKTIFFDQELNDVPALIDKLKKLGLDL